MARIRRIKMKPRRTCPPNYRLSLRGTKVGLSCFLKPRWGSVVCLLKCLTHICLMFCSPGKQTEGNARLYRAGCLILAMISLVLLLVVIILGLKREYLRPCQWIHPNDLKTVHCWQRAVAVDGNAEKIQCMYLSRLCWYCTFSHNNKQHRNAKCGWLSCLGQKALFFSLTAPPTVLWFLVQTGSTVCPESEETAVINKAQTCSFEQCQLLFPSSPASRKCSACKNKRGMF